MKANLNNFPAKTFKRIMCFAFGYIFLDKADGRNLSE